MSPFSHLVPVDPSPERIISGVFAKLPAADVSDQMSEDVGVSFAGWCDIPGFSIFGGI